MKAAVLVAHNTPLEIRQVADPVVHPGQVLIKVHASGLCGTDVHLYTGLFAAPLPIVPGHEGVGEVVQVGAGVDTLRVGDRVGVSWVQRGCGRCPCCQQQRPRYCPDQQSWVQLGGAHAEYTVAWAEGCTLLPKGLAYETAAPLFCAGFTIASGFANAVPRPGERIAVLGLGGLGHLALQYAKAKGFWVAVLTHSPGKAKLAKELGADEVIDSSGHVGKALAKAGGADIVLNTGNSSKLASEVLEGLLPEGRLINMGLDDDPIVVAPFTLLGQQLRVIGSKQNARRDLVDILQLAAQGKVKPMIELYPLDQINRVIERVQKNEVRFRAVLQP